MRLGDPQQLADDGARQRLGEVGDDVHPAGRRHAIEQRVDVGLDRAAERLDGARRERPAHRVAEPRVVRRVPEEHRLPVAAGVRAVAVVRREVPLEPLAAEPRVAEDRGHVGVAREDPQAVRRAVDRVSAAEASVEAGYGSARSRESDGSKRVALATAASGATGCRCDCSSCGCRIAWSVMPEAEGNAGASSATKPVHPPNSLKGRGITSPRHSSVTVGDSAPYPLRAANGADSER